jgi:NAD(P)-dependent dehydrogenase (short-subunit alcohol dehydrogenase family)
VKFDLSSRRVWVTGASSGIGRAVAIEFARRGCSVALSARNRSTLEDVARECLGRRAIVVPLDVTDLRANLEATGKIASELGGIDIAFLNAGTCEYIDARDFDAALCERVMRANFVGLANGIEAVLPVLRNSPHAQLVGMSSTVAFGPLPRAEAYGASKAAIRYLMESLRIDLRGEPVSITVVCPGFVKTPLTDRNDFPMPFLIGAEDAARIIVDGVAARQPEIDFPRRLSIPFKVAAMLPTPLYTRLAALITGH